MTEAETEKKNDRSFLKTILLVVIVASVTSALTLALTTVQVFPRSFKPVELNHDEKIVLDMKVQNLENGLKKTPDTPTKTVKMPRPATQNAPLVPEKYSEEGASREVTFTEREINALIGENTDLANRVAVDFSPDLISVKALIPLDPELPVFGGKTLRLSAGAEVLYKSGRPAVILKGVSLWGVPLPNDWLGDLKNIDLIDQYGDKGFWKAFAAGVENIAVGDGTLTVKLHK